MSGTGDPRIHVDLAHLRALRGRARSITFRPRQPSNSILNGQHASKIKGRGLNFEELRHYAMGDDIRTIDWKVTARTGDPYIRVYTEERDRPVLLVVDQRMSMFFGSRLNMKSVTAAEAAAVSAFRVRAKGDRVGGIIFDDTGMQEVRPQSSARALNRLLDALATANGRLNAEAPVSGHLSLNQPLKAAARIAKSGGLVLVFSDFDGWDDASEESLRRIAMHNELILFSIYDPTSQHLPENLKMIVSDGELQAQIDVGDETVRRRLAEYSSGRLASLFAFSRKYAVPVVPLTSAEETVPQLLHLFGRSAAMNGEDLSGLDLVALYDRLIRPDAPEAISMWPQTAGWIWLGLAVAALLAAAAWVWIRRHRANAYRRAALKALDAAGDDPARIAEVLRRTALQAYPRETVAGIHGASWLAFLDQATGRTDFAGSEAGRVLVTAPYRPQAPDKDLPALAARWIRTHRGVERA